MSALKPKTQEPIIPCVKKKPIQSMTIEQLRDYADCLEDRLEKAYQRNLYRSRDPTEDELLQQVKEQQDQLNSAADVNMSIRQDFDRLVDILNAKDNKAVAYEEEVRGLQSESWELRQKIASLERNQRRLKTQLSSKNKKAKASLVVPCLVDSTETYLL